MPAVLPTQSFGGAWIPQASAVTTDPRFVANPQGLDADSLAKERAPLYANGGVPMMDNQGNLTNSKTGQKGARIANPGQASPFGMRPGTTLGTPFAMPSRGRRGQAGGGYPDPNSGIAPYGGDDLARGGRGVYPTDGYVEQPNTTAGGDQIDPKQSADEFTGAARGRILPGVTSTPKRQPRGSSAYLGAVPAEKMQDAALQERAGSSPVTPGQLHNAAAAGIAQQPLIPTLGSSANMGPVKRGGVPWQINDRPDGEQEAVHDPSTGNWMTTPTQDAVITNHTPQAASVALVKDLKQKGVPVKQMPQGSSADLSPVPGAASHHGSPITIHIHAGITQSKGKPRGSSANKQPLPPRGAIAPPPGMMPQQGSPQSPVSPPPLPQAPTAAQAVPQSPQPGMPMTPQAQPGMPQQPGMPPMGIAPPPTIIPPGTPMPKGYAQPPTLQQVPTDRGNGSISQHNGITETPDASPGGASRDKRPVPGIRETPGKMPKGSSAETYDTKVPGAPASGFTPVAKTHGNKNGGNFPTSHRNLAGPTTNVISKTGAPVIPAAIQRAQIFNNSHLPWQGKWMQDQLNRGMASGEIDRHTGIITRGPSKGMLATPVLERMAATPGVVPDDQIAAYSHEANPGSPVDPNAKFYTPGIGQFGKGSVLSAPQNSNSGIAPAHPWTSTVQDAISNLPAGVDKSQVASDAAKQIGTGAQWRPGAQSVVQAFGKASQNASAADAAAHAYRVPGDGSVQETAPGVREIVGSKYGTGVSAKPGAVEAATPAPASNIPTAEDAANDAIEKTVKDEGQDPVDEEEVTTQNTPSSAKPSPALNYNPNGVNVRAGFLPAATDITGNASIAAMRPIRKGIATARDWINGNVFGVKTHNAEEADAVNDAVDKVNQVEGKQRVADQNKQNGIAPPDQNAPAQPPVSSSPTPTTEKVTNMEAGPNFGKPYDASGSGIAPPTSGHSALYNRTVAAYRARQSAEKEDAARDDYEKQQSAFTLQQRQKAMDATPAAPSGAVPTIRDQNIFDDKSPAVGVTDPTEGLNVNQADKSQDQDQNNTAAKGRTLPGRMNPKSDMGIAPHAGSLALMAKIAPLLVGAHHMLEQHSRGGMKQSFQGGQLPGQKRGWDGGTVPDLAPGMVGDYRAKDFTCAMASDKKPEFKMAFLGGSLPGRGYDGGSIGDMPRGMVNDYDGKDFTGALESGVHKAAKGRKLPGRKMAMPMPSAGIAPPPTMPPMQPPSQDQGNVPPPVVPVPQRQAARGRTMSGIADPNQTSTMESGLVKGPGELAVRHSDGAMQILTKPNQVVRNSGKSPVSIYPSDKSGVVRKIGYPKH